MTGGQCEHEHPQMRRRGGAPSSERERGQMSLFAPGLARTKHHLTFCPAASDVPSTYPWAQALFVTQARAAPYDDLVATCLKDPSLKTCAAVLIERFCFENGVDPVTFAYIQGRLEAHMGYKVHALDLGMDFQCIDLTRLPQNALHELVKNAPTWEQAKRKRMRGEWVESSA